MAGEGVDYTRSEPNHGIVMLHARFGGDALITVNVEHTLSQTRGSDRWNQFTFLPPALPCRDSRKRRFCDTVRESKRKHYCFFLYLCFDVDPFLLGGLVS